MFTIRPFNRADTDAVIALWQACGLTRVWNDPLADIKCKMKVQPELFIIGEMSDSVIASAMFGYDGHRGWLYYFAVSPEYQNQGYGRRLLAHGEEALKSRGCPKINIQIRADHTAVKTFYDTSGFRQDDVMSMGKRLDDLSE